MSTGLVGVNFCLVRDNHILLQQRDEHCTRHPHEWCIPGGRCEDGETYQETVLREVYEEYELTLAPADCTKIGDKPDGEVWLCNVPNNQTPIMHEGEAMQWFNIVALSELELGFNQNTIIVPRLLSFLKNKSIT